MDFMVKSSFVPPRPEAASAGTTKFMASVCIKSRATMVKGIIRRMYISKLAQHD
jgi:hypothetical protein